MIKQRVPTADKNLKKLQISDMHQDIYIASPQAKRAKT
jgi:hypothetical protein